MALLSHLPPPPLAGLVLVPWRIFFITMKRRFREPIRLEEKFQQFYKFSEQLDPFVALVSLIFVCLPLVLKMTVFPNLRIISEKEFFLYKTK